MRPISELTDFELSNYSASVDRNVQHMAQALYDERQRLKDIHYEIRARAALAMFRQFDNDTADTVANLMRLLGVPVSRIDALKAGREAAK